MLFRSRTLLLAALLALPSLGMVNATAQEGTPDAGCVTNPVHFVELSWQEADAYLAAPDATEETREHIVSVLDAYADALNRVDIQGALDLMTPDLADWFGWDCLVEAGGVTPAATPEPYEYVIEQVRLFDDDTATAFLSLPDKVHGPQPGQVSDRVFLVVLERSGEEWEIARIGTMLVFRDVIRGSSGQQMMYPAIDLRDNGMPQMPHDATPLP